MEVLSFLPILGEVKKVKNYGWFSQEAADKFGSVVWETPEGKLVEITAVVSANDQYLWPDKILVGEVKNYVRRGRTALSIPALSEKYGDSTAKFIQALRSLDDQLKMELL